MVAAQSGISKSLKTGKYRGTPAVPINEFNRREVYVRRLEEYAERLKALEEKMIQ
jgi:UDP-3-O-[3-hydroxymyristoyl] glucosamine N-acyltransferase